MYNIYVHIALTCRPICFKKRKLFPNGSAGVSSCVISNDAPSVVAVVTKRLLLALLLPGVGLNR